MSDNEANSVTIDIKKPKKYDKNKNIFKTDHLKLSTKTKLTMKKYTLPAITVIKPPPANTLKRDDILLPYLRYSRKQKVNKTKERLGICIRDDYKIAYNDLRERLDTEDPINDTFGVTDFDPTFFMCLKSTLLSNYVAPYKSLRHLFNTQLRLRQEVGYRRDTMLNIDTNNKKEQEIYNASVKKHMEQVKYLDDFISTDYKKSMSILAKCEELKVAVIEHDYELQCLAAEMFTITSKIVGLDYRHGLQQKYGRFLYYLSPPSWRLKNRTFARSIEIEAKGFDFGVSSEEDTFNVIFEKLKRECDLELVRPVLYFKQPNDLLQIFDGIEQQQLHHFTHVARLAPHASFLKKGIKLFKDIITQDSCGIVTVIKEFENMLRFCEDQCSQLEAKFFKILNTSFYNNVGSPEVLKFQMHLEFCYAKVNNEKPMNLGIMGTAKALEDIYMKYTKLLESVTAASITSAIKQILASERRKFRRAKMAAKELLLFERLERALLRAYAPVKAIKSSFVAQKCKTNVKKHRPSKKLLPASSSNDEWKKLTESEIEYLRLFTDWAETEDPTIYLRSLSIQNIETGN